MSQTIQFTLNGKEQRIKTEPKRPFLDVLREDLNLTGTKYGCGENECRACTVLLDGKPVTTCRMPASAADGHEILTIEGLASNDRLHPVQKAFIEESAMQCGFCVPGIILRTVGLLKDNPSPSREEIVKALDGSICRCCGYVNILQAAERAAKLVQKEANV